jgi:hypothetical protein
MASPRRRSSYPSQEVPEEIIDEISNISEEEIVEEVPEEKIEEVATEPEPPVVLVLPDLVPTEAPPPVPLKEAAKLGITALAKQESILQLKEPPKRHPRNTPKFSTKRG